MSPSHWTHNREYFYKYMSADAAKVVLRSNSLRWSSPTLFNDPFDVQFDLHVEYDRERVAAKAMEAIIDSYMGRRPIDPRNPLGVMLLIMRDQSPGITEDQLRREIGPGLFEGMNHGEQLIPEVHRQFRALIGDLKLLCLTEVYDNILMWAHYGKEHTGVVLELRCVESLDSAWGGAQPVRYEQNMPRLIDDDKLVAILSGVGNLQENRIFDNSVYVKAADWAYEKEWRLVGVRDKASLTEDFAFHIDELSGIYFGCRASAADMDEITSILSEKYPRAVIHLGKKSERHFSVDFEKLERAS